MNIGKDTKIEIRYQQIKRFIHPVMITALGTTGIISYSLQCKRLGVADIGFMVTFFSLVVSAGIYGCYHEYKNSTELQHVELSQVDESTQKE